MKTPLPQELGEIPMHTGIEPQLHSGHPQKLHDTAETLMRAEPT